MDYEDVPPPLEYVNNVDDDNRSDRSDDDTDDEETMDSGEPTTCLFCDKVEKTIEAAIEHVRDDHKINFNELKNKFQMDQYSFIKLINCIRLKSINAQRLAEATEIFWNNDKYLKPIKYEPWLTYDYEEMPMTKSLRTTDNNALNSNATEEALKQQLKKQSLLLEQAYEDMAKMRIGFQRIVGKVDDVAEDTTKAKSVHCVQSQTLKADEGYFSSYAHFGIHHEMLSDTVRTTSYRDALLENKDIVRGKDVLDVGCGTSVLSIFASQAGARMVVGIDNSDIIYNAMDIVKNNNIENVTLVKGRLEDAELPQQKYDIIISEWMGYFLLFEGMLDSVIYARDHHLKEGGILLPNRCTMSILGYGNESLFKSHVAFWDDVYGLDMSNMRKEVLHEPLIDIVDSQYILTKPETIADLNLATIDLNYSNFAYNFKLKCTRNGNLSAFVGYFDTHFELPHPVSFGTAPTDKPTHWKQVVFFLEQPRAVKTGDEIDGKITCRRSRSNARSLDIIIEAFNQKYTFHLD